MKQVLYLIVVLNGLSFADKGTVVLEDVCGDKIVIKTTDDWYIAAEWYGGKEFSRGETVFGNMKTYGMEELFDKNGNNGSYYIEDWESSLESAIEELCD